MGKRVLTVVGLLVLHALVCVLAARAGYAMRIAWHHYQILDRVALEEHPLLSIWLLHSQPPLLNVALAAVLRIAAWLRPGARSSARAP